MKKKLMVVLGALSLMACGGSGKPWSGDGPAPTGQTPTTLGGTGGSEAVPVGGYEAGGSYAVGGSAAVGGYEAGGSYGVGGSYEAGGSYGVGGTGIDVGGYEAGGTGGYSSAGTGYGGFESGGTGSQDPACSQNVVHCFDAAANCYQYSPSSDCDQIVDVCAAMQMDCNE
jgi:hypothetical protein